MRVSRFSPCTLSFRTPCVSLLAAYFRPPAQCVVATNAGQVSPQPQKDITKQARAVESGSKSPEDVIKYSRSVEGVLKPADGTSNMKGILILISPVNNLWNQLYRSGPSNRAAAYSQASAWSRKSAIQVCS